MLIRELAVPGAYVVEPELRDDARGTFAEWFRADRLAGATGRDLGLAQANVSVSSAGALRGIHYADVPPGQAKYVTCVSGAALDVVVDLRVGSPTFGRWDAVGLDDRTRRCVFLSEGLGHGFMALRDGTVVTYLCSTPYTPEREHVVDPFDADLGITWPTTGPDGVALQPLLSDRDRDAPGLHEARSSGRLPRYEAVTRFVAGLTGRR